MRVRGVDVVSGEARSLEIRDGFVAGIERIPSEPGMPWLSRGFLDIQVNGYRGIDYSGAGLEGADVTRMAGFLAVSGTTRHVPTIITNSRERILRNLEIIAGAVSSVPGLAAAIPGIHLEGPFICRDEGPRGAHDPRYVRDPSLAEFEEWIAASRGLLRMVTLAPELDGALELIEEGVRRGVVMAIGHTAASGDRIARAVAAGASLSTHLGNGSHATVPRLRNYLWEQLGADGLAASVIADGFHLPESVLKVFARAKGLERLVLVSDVASLGGSEPGAYRWGDVEVEVFPDRHIGLRGTPFLAGAGHLLDWDIAHFARATGTDIRDAVRLATSNPEAVLGLPSPGPGFRVGDRADLTRFTYDASGGPLVILDTVFGTEIRR